jgi:hypothetical protein
VIFSAFLFIFDTSIIAPQSSLLHKSISYEDHKGCRNTPSYQEEIDVLATHIDKMRHPEAENWLASLVLLTFFCLFFLVGFFSFFYLVVFIMVFLFFGVSLMFIESIVHGYRLV